ncbi:NADP-dependent succinic semialdehyde dehydrogenase [Streptomyces sp. SID3343]|uniref:NADP-dependent succinic semialdehyde dehydrogenase n=1 Tax=Streptomyces sp. SID3343 TaxID=2690260 RepID=UPI00136B476B|nr:NADP-dependent succinic semialdehyde dehydrogenase [Streptomyces sp. SID3343]MYW05214.1 NADP-dependent succinic semialdehyde dehydrogenase [Streptomyces sp. SID3343]
MAIASVNPATGETWKEFSALTEQEIDACIARSDEVFRAHRRDTYAVRAGHMRRVGGLLDAERADVARLMTAEMGKTIAAAEAEVAKCAKLCRFYAERAEGFLAEEPADAAAVGARRAYVRYEPLGPVLAVMPWNFPLWQAMRFAVPALMAGNTGLLKHASNVPQTALYMGDLFTRGGFPEGAFQTLLIGSKQVEHVLSDPRVVAATLTGSEGAGRSIAAIAGRELKKTVLELGGSDPFLVLPSADIEAAAKTATTARTQNNGQSCIAAKRFIVHADVYDAFARAFTANMSALKVGDPTAPGTDVGPLAQEQGVRDVTEQVDDAKAKGARVLCGGERPHGPGWFYPPTIVADLTPDMRMYAEEVFGPVAGLYKVADLDEAITLANATPFGLGANAWTTDDAEQRRCAQELAAGAVFVNGMVTSYPELPFGGIKTSGYGRELAQLGIREFCNAKTVWMG